MVNKLLFSQNEFDIMIDELLFRDPISFDMLCQIAIKFLSPKVVRWCRSIDCLRGRNLEDDIMQDICLLLMNKTVDYFLLNKGHEGAANKRPDEFGAWMTTLAKNYVLSYAKSVGYRDSKLVGLDDSNAPELPSPEEPVDEEAERIDKLKQAFTIVISSDVGVYKILTWLAQFVFILDKDVTKIKSNEIIIATFEQKTLNEMYSMILLASKRIPWMVITESQHNNILSALKKPWDDQYSYGEIRYKDFFMKQSGNISGKKSISDWVNRMNDMIKRRMGNPELYEKKKTIRNKQENGDAKKDTIKGRRGEGGTSDS